MSVWLLGALVVIAPLPFGSVHGWAVSALEVIVLGSLAAAWVRDPDEILAAARPLLVPAALLLGLLLFELVPLPSSVMTLVSPKTAALYHMLLEDTGRWHTLSIDPYQSGLSLLRLGAYAGAFLIAASASLPGRGTVLVWAILLSGGLAAATSWWHTSVGWTGHLFGRFASQDQVADLTRLHWPFVNANHLAAAMNAAWPLALGAIFRPRLFGAKQPIASTCCRLFGAAVLVSTLLTLAGTSSRGGGLAAAVAALVFAVLWPSESRVARTAAGAGQLTAIAAGVVLVAWMGWEAAHKTSGSITLAALDRSDATLLVRLEAMRQSLPILRDFWLFGTGLGTWPEIFPRYQSYPLYFGSFPHLHNDWLELLCDIGVSSAAILLVLALRYVRHVGNGRNGPGARELAILAAATVAFAVQAFGDFALRIPANALSFSVLLGVLWRAAAPAADRPVVATAAAVPRSFVLPVTLCALCLLYPATFEWRDGRWLEAIRQNRAVDAGDTGNWLVHERLAWTRRGRGEPSVDSALRAVSAGPLNAAGHRTLAFCYRSMRMRELELGRAVECAPGDRALRIEHATLVAARRGVAAAAREIEKAFYAGAETHDRNLLEYRDPATGGWPFLDAAIRGAGRRLGESPEAWSDIAALRRLRETLQARHERERHGQ
ncbi:MAG: O-antigen ligase family protein [Candidatus Binatia bacterium]